MSRSVEVSVMEFNGDGEMPSYVEQVVTTGVRRHDRTEKVK
jgi:hypothetical protein